MMIYTKILRCLLTFLLLAVCGIGYANNAASQYGVCTHINHPWNPDYKLAEKEMKIISENHIPWMRTDFDWQFFEKSPGVWDFTRLDEMMNLADKYGVKILPILKGSPKWAYPSHQHHDKWRVYVNKIVSRYKDRLKYWEVWNEENAKPFWKVTPNAKDYAKLLKVTYEEIKSIDSDITVLMGGTSFLPMLYLDTFFIAGGGNYCDVINIHPYVLPHSPELRHLYRDINELKELMAKHKVNKPIWITELGWKTPKFGQLRKHIIHSGLKAAGLDPKTCSAAMIVDTKLDYIATNTGNIFPDLKKVKKISLEELKTLSPSEYQVLLLPSSEYFNSNYFEYLKNYMKNGGIAIFTGGAPLFKHQDKYALVQTRCKKQLNKALLEKLHINWDASWTKKGLPVATKNFEFAEQFKAPEGIHKKGLKTYLYLNEDKLKSGDKMIPVCYGVNQYGFKGCVAAYYKFNSDFKGGAIVSTFRMISEGVTEEEQAQFLPRSILISFQAGIDKFFWYNLLSSENSPYYGHYGLLHRDLSPKPAFTAFATLAKLRPTGSVQDNYSVKDDVYSISWKTPDNKRIWAIWSPYDNKVCKFKVNGEIMSAVDYLGKSIDAPVAEGHVSIQASKGVIYLKGDVGLNLQLQ